MLHQPAILSAGNLPVGGITGASLPGVGFSLVPQKGPKSAGPKRVDTPHEAPIQIAGTEPVARRDRFDEIVKRWMDVNGFPFLEPLPDARGSAPR